MDIAISKVHSVVLAERREEKVAFWQEQFRSFLRIEAFVNGWHSEQIGSRDHADFARRKVDLMRALFLSNRPEVEVLSELMGEARRAILTGGHPKASSVSL